MSNDSRVELTIQQKEEIDHSGYVRLAGVVPQKLIQIALRAINHSIGRGISAADTRRYRSDSFCPELRNQKCITDLLFATPLFSMAESATYPGDLRFPGDGQIALRFPVMETPGELHPHLDGMPYPGNRVGKGKIESFTLLAGVFLSDVPNRYWGNFTVWPGTHRIYELYFREHGVRSLRKRLPPVALPQPVQILARAGDAILCHYQLAHTAVINVSPFVRYAVFFRLRHKDHARHGEAVFTDIWMEWRGIREQRH